MIFHIKDMEKLMMTMSISQKSSLQPKALYIITLAELWERFSFYGVRALLILYFTSQLEYNDTEAYSLYGLYLALIYSSTVLGSYLSDSYLGNRKALYMGGFIIALGHLCLALPFDFLFHYGLAFIITGTGLFKANVSSFLGEFYVKNDSRRDAGFTLFYMGINIGSLIAPLLCGYVGHKYGWHYGFSIAGIGVLLGIVTLYYGANTLEDKGLSPSEEKLHEPYLFKVSRFWLIWIGCILSVPLFVWSLRNPDLMGNFLNIFGIMILMVLAFITYQCKGEDRKSIITLLVMLPFVTAFFISFEQAGGSMSLFADRHIIRNIGELEIPTAWFQSLNPFFIILIAPIFSIIWKFLGQRRQEPLPPLKFSFALFQVSLSFWFLKTGINTANDMNMISIVWLIFAILLQTTGELCLMPIAFSMVTKLAPRRFASFMMGTLFLFIAFANLFAQQMAKYFSTSQEINSLENLSRTTLSLSTFKEIFEFLTYFPFIAGIVLLTISPFLKKVFERNN